MNKKFYISISLVLLLFLCMGIFLINSNFVKTLTGVSKEMSWVINPIIELENFSASDDIENKKPESDLEEQTPPTSNKPNTSKPDINEPNTSSKPNQNEDNKPTEPEKPMPPEKEPPIIAEPSEPKTVDELVKAMSLEEKIAQMTIISFNGKSLSSKLTTSLSYTPGGVILFANNISDYAGTTKLINDIKDKTKITPFIAVDQEGGRVQRIKDIVGTNVKTIAPMWDIGETKDTNLAYLTGKSIGNDLKKFGFNLDFAPVIDVVPDVTQGLIKDRSFGSDPYLVGKMGIFLAKGLKEEGIVSSYKHFPGHGATITDSHVSLPIISKTKEELLNSDLVPFKEAIKNDAKIIMVGHLAVPKITGNNTPASLSKIVINDLLKNELGYKNLVITDALNMKALTENYSEKSIYEMAINAGVDILLMPTSVENAITNIKKSIQEGKIREEKITESVKKIMKLKKEYNLI